MRLLVVCESPPTTDPALGNGSTMIPALVLPRLPARIRIDLAWFDDRPIGPDETVLRRCQSAEALPMRAGAFGAAAAVGSALPRATWLRDGRRARNRTAALARRADVVYLHGLHTFALSRRLRAPLVAHEVDPWSLHWRQRARCGPLHRRIYDRTQARRAAALEARTAARASAYVVVSDADAGVLTERLRRPVRAVPNGFDPGLAPVPAEEASPHVVGFVGSLDYAPNVEAVRELVESVLPKVRALVPEARVVVAGRRPVPGVLALAGERVEVLGDVVSVREVFGRAAVLAYPGGLGFGRKNTVMEALACGRPVVASAVAARGLEPGEHLAIADHPAGMAERVAELLRDPVRRRRAGEHAARVAAGFPSWDATAAALAELFDDAAG